MEIAIQTAGEYGYLVATARWAEQAGLACFALPDHYLRRGSPEAPVYDALTQAAALARDTDRIELALLVSPITFRHPAVLAKVAATIDEIAGGRFHLGVGAGWMEEEHRLFGLPFPPERERFDLMEEALGYLRAALDGDQGFAGEHYHLEPFAPQPRTSGSFRLIVGGSGAERTPELAGRFADEFNASLTPGGIPDLVRRVGRAQRAAVTAGRDATALMLSSIGVTVCGPDEGSYRARLAEAATAMSTSPEALEERMRAHGVPHGPVDRVRDSVAQLGEAGVTRFYIQWFRRPDRALLEETVEALTG